MSTSYVIKNGHDYVQCKQYGLAMSAHYVHYHRQATRYASHDAANMMRHALETYLGSQDLRVVRVTEHAI